jgi:hypothetical protein
MFLITFRNKFFADDVTAISDLKNDMAKYKAARLFVPAKVRILAEFHASAMPEGLQVLGSCDCRPCCRATSVQMAGVGCRRCGEGKRSQRG